MLKISYNSILATIMLCFMLIAVIMMFDLIIGSSNIYQKPLKLGLMLAANLCSLLLAKSLSILNKKAYIFSFIALLLTIIAVIELFFFANKTFYLFTALASLANIPYVYSFNTFMKILLMAFFGKTNEENEHIPA